jgi:hypothetical protein
MTPHSIRCRCGRLQGVLAADARCVRAVCYCRDCQTYAHALKDPATVLDERGGTDIVATLQQYVTFEQGREALACLSLSERGLLRWYASCCDTPIANTARDPKLSYLGLVHTCLGDSREALDAAYGATRIPVNTEHAKEGLDESSFWTRLIAVLGIIRRVLGARMSGAWKRSAFFGADLQPVVKPRVLTLEERERARAAI